MSINQVQMPAKYGVAKILTPTSVAHFSVLSAHLVFDKNDMAICSVREVPPGLKQVDVANRIKVCLDSHDVMVAALKQAQKWIQGAMLENGFPQERIDNPPQGSHLFNINAALIAAGEA